MPIKAAVCDDSRADADYVMSLVKSWANQRGISLALSDFTSAEAFLFAYEDDADWDILLLDIEMGAMDGVTLAKQLRRSNETVQIIFITGYSDYIAEGYEVSALHYLMKPLQTEKLFSVLDRAAERLSKNERMLTLESGGSLVRIPLYHIRYIDIQHNYATVHAKEDCTVKKSLAELALLLDERFYRVGRSAIVNLSLIRRVTRSEIHLDDGTVIPLPRGAYEGVNRAIIDMH